MGGLLVSCMRSIFHTTRHLHMPSLPRFTSGSRRQIHSPPAGLAVVLHGGTIPSELEEAVLHAVEEDTMTSTQWVAHRINVDQKTVWRILHNQQLHPYHPERVQAMCPEDFVSQVNFCRWFLHHRIDEPNFPWWILFTDEAKFTREDVINFHSSHVCAVESHMLCAPHGFQQCYGFNMWVGFLDACDIGPYLVLPNLTGDAYRTWISFNIYCMGSWKMWLQHDGTPPHITCDVRGYLDRRFGQMWIGHSGPIGWPAHLLDLTPLDYFTVVPHKELGLWDPCGFRGRPAGAGYGCGGYWWSCVREHGM